MRILRHSGNFLRFPTTISPQQSIRKRLHGNLCDLFVSNSFFTRDQQRQVPLAKMDSKIIVTSHPRYGYYYDIKTSDQTVPFIPNLGVSRRSVFDEVKTPAYK